MATFGHRAGAGAGAGVGQHPQAMAAAVFAAPASVGRQAAPAGTFAPGTKIQVGKHRVVIQKYLSEGGFAHVYLVKMPAPVNGTDVAVLKRVAVPDKDALRGMRTEVETMKRLKGHRAIVTYIDSHASELRGGGYEVFLLMEFCDGGGLIDFMNTRLQHRLTEPEILKIFADVAEGVACMHYLQPPLLHRDIKIENVLISSTGSSKRFKVCDFGSAAAPTPAPTSISECRRLDEDVQRHTTLQYRSPEMVDVHRKQPIDESSDIWALGVFLYKLCYYTTPFEEQGQLAILNASYRFPSLPVFSDRLKKLIAWMLQEQQKARPNIYQVLKEACAMQGCDVPIRDIYTAGAKSQTSTLEGGASLKNPTPTTTPTPTVGVSLSTAPAPAQSKPIPDITPMRRGRPPATLPVPGIGNTPAMVVSSSAIPSKVVTNGDPFAALDHRTAISPPDELSAKFPTLNEFSLLHGSTPAAYDFGSTATGSRSPAYAVAPSHIAATPAAAAVEARQKNPVAAPSGTGRLAAPAHRLLSPSNPKPAGFVASPLPMSPRLVEQAPVSTMVSQGTMTDRALPSEIPIYRFPPADQPRTTTAGIVSRQSYENRLQSIEPLVMSKTKAPAKKPRPVSTHLESNLEFLRQQENARNSVLMGTAKYDSDGETTSYDSPDDNDNDNDNGNGNDNDNDIESNVEFMRAMEDEGGIGGRRRKWNNRKRSSVVSIPSPKLITSGKFGSAFKMFEANHTSSNNKLPTPRTHSPLAGPSLKVNLTAAVPTNSSVVAPSPRHETIETTTTKVGSDLIDLHEYGNGDDENMSPEARRERERRRLSAEEKRVAAAAAEYRSRVASGQVVGHGVGLGRSTSYSNATANAFSQSAKTEGAVPNTNSSPLLRTSSNMGGGGGSGSSSNGGGVFRATTIQSKVQQLLDESKRAASQITRTAEGYGKYTDNEKDTEQGREPEREREQEIPSGWGSSSTRRMSAVEAKPDGSKINNNSNNNTLSSSSNHQVRLVGSSSTVPTAATDIASASSSPKKPPPPPPPKPVPKPKPSHLNHVKAVVARPTSSAAAQPGVKTTTSVKPRIKLAAAAVGGVGSNDNDDVDVDDDNGNGNGISNDDGDGNGDGGFDGHGDERMVGMTEQQRVDYIREFQKRFPSLTSLEMDS